MAIFSSDIVTSAISASITDTAVDVFIYDTSKDSDGGAWRKRTTHTSWYNESLNTATRGSRKDFPAVAVIVAEATKVTIYDGDDPDLPLWITFPTTAAKGVTALNGELCLCSYATASAYHGLLRINFVADQAINHRESNSATVQGYFIYTLSSTDLAKIDDGPSSWTGYTSEVPNIVNGNCNDLAMTVLPNAPVDSATGLPVPTIAVATDGGLSIIKDDGTVVDATPSSSAWYPTSVSTYGRNKFITGTGSGGAGGYILPVFDSDTSYNITSNPPSNGWLHFRSNGTNADIFLDLNENPTTTSLPITALSPIGAGSAKGMNIFDVNDNSHSDSLVAYVTSHYNTGYMHGDIKGAFLSDTDTTNITGSEKIANYNFAADFSTQWEVKNSANTSYDATNDRVTVTSTQNYSGIRLKSASLPTLTNGKRYIMTVNIHSITNSIRFGVVSGGNKDSVNSTGAHTLMFTAGASISEVYIEKPSGSNSTFVLNSVSIREAEEDRSVNDKGLAVYGTITKSAVATGAEVVGYSGFSGSNYLKQPFTATTINHGTGDFCYVMWVNIDSSGTDSQTFVDRSSSNGGVSNPRIRIHKHTNGVLRFYTNGGSVLSTTNLENIGWTHLACVRRGSTIEVWVNGYLENTGSSSTDFTSTDGQIQIGVDGDESDPLTAGSITLVRISHSAPSAEQIKKMYEDEKVLFQENAKATLYGSSDAVTALAYDEVTDLLHVGTSAGRSDFQGLRRINNTTTAVTTAISAHDEFIIEQ
jgi:hypothetical protein